MTDDTHAAPVRQQTTKDNVAPASTPTWFHGSSWEPLIAADVLRSGPVSRTPLAGYHGLSQGTLSRIIKTLTLGNVVHTTRRDARADHVPKYLRTAATSSAKAGRGRPQQNLAINHNAATFIGVNVREDIVRAGAVNVACELGGSQIHSQDLASTEPQSVARTIAGLVSTCEDDLVQRQLPAPSLIGISIGGHIEGDGTCGYAPFMHWDERVDLAGLVQQECGIPTRLFNNIAAYMRYMQWFGEGSGMENFAVVTIGAGVGYGLVSAGRVVEAPGSSYGLAGHIIIDPDGPECFLHKGHRGCSQCLTDESLAYEYSGMIGGEHSFADYARDAQDTRKPKAQRLKVIEAHRLGALIGTVANLAMVDRVFIGGESNWVVQSEGEIISSGISDLRPSQAPAVPFTFLDERTTDDRRWILGAATAVIRQYVLGEAITQ